MTGLSNLNDYASSKRKPFTNSRPVYSDAKVKTQTTEYNPNVYNRYVKTFISDRLNSNYDAPEPLKVDNRKIGDAQLESTNEYLQNVKVQLHDHSSTESINNSKYFAEGSTTLYEEEGDSSRKQAPTALLVDPYARKGSTKSKFNLAPCGGGIKGKSRYLASPGEKTEVQWIIEHPVKNGKCKVSISKGHPDDLNSYQVLTVNNPTLDKRTGQFS